MAKRQRTNEISRTEPPAPGQRLFSAPRKWVVVIPVLAVALLAVIGTYLFVRSGDNAQSTDPNLLPQGGPVAGGQAVQPFTLMNQFGKPVSITPGDGKIYLLVFYMGYF